MNLFQPNENNGKECVINQFFGLGDCLFIEPIYRHFHELGYKVIAPVLPQYLWLQDYIPYVEFKNKDQYRYRYDSVEQINDGRLHVPVRFSHPLYRGHHLHYGDDRKNWMRDKYLFLGLDEWTWTKMKWERKMDKEQSLFNKYEISGPYNLINENWGGSFERISINPNNGLRNIKVEKVPGYTMLDWGMLIENAENIYTVETAFVWPVEILTTKGELNLYPRHPALTDVKYFEGQLIKNWIFHDSTDLK